MTKIYGTIKKRKYWFLSAVVLAILAGAALFDNIKVVKGYTTYDDAFIVIDANDIEIFRIEDSGRAVYQGGELLWDTNAAELPAQSNPYNSECFEVRNENNEIVFCAEYDEDGEKGIVHLNGTVYPTYNNGNPLNDPGRSAFLIFKNADGEIFAYINSDNGSLYLMSVAAGYGG